MADEDEYIRMRGTVQRVLRSATFLVELEGGLEVTARPSATAAEIQSIVSRRVQESRPAA